MFFVFEKYIATSERYTLSKARMLIHIMLPTVHVTCPVRMSCTITGKCYTPAVACQ